MPRRTALAVALAIAVPSCVAAQTAAGVGVYPSWTIRSLTPGETSAQERAGTISFGVMGFPAGGEYVNRKTVRDMQPVALRAADTIVASSSWGSVFGASTGREYLFVRTDRAQGAVATATYEFARPLPPGAWGFTLGDIDVDEVDITARSSDGSLLSGAEIAGSVGNARVPYNFEGRSSSTLPTWTPGGAGGTLAGPGGSASETEGDAGWFMPSRSVRELTVRFEAGPSSDSPSYRTWFAVVAHPISGTVLREDTGKGVEGDVLTLLDPQGDVLDVTTSDAAGNYVFPNVYAQPGYTVIMKPPAGLAAVGASSLGVSTQAGPGRADFLLRPGTGTGGTGTSNAESSVGYSTGDAAIVLTPGLQAARVGVARRITVESTCTLRTRATLPAGMALVSASGAVRSGRTVTWTGGTGAYRLVVRPVSGPRRVARIRVSTNCADGSVATATSRLRIIAARPLPVTG